MPDIATVKYSPAGKELWVRRYLGPADGRDSGRKILLDGKGGVYVFGFSRAGGNNEDSSDLVLLKYTAEGHEDWAQRYSGGTNDLDAARGAGLDRAGDVYCTGLVRAKGSAVNSTITLKYNGKGDLVWKCPYNGGGHGAAPNCIMLDRENDVVVAGAVDMGKSTDGAPRSDYFVLKYSPTGVLLRDVTERWFSGSNKPTSVLVGQQNNIFVTGEIEIAGHKAFGTLSLNAQCKTKWKQSFQGPGGIFDCPARQLALDSAGNVYVTGQADYMNPQHPNLAEASSPEYSTVQYSPNGIQRRLLRYHGPRYMGTGALCIVVAQGDCVVVAGLADKGMVTVKYCPASAMSP